MLNNLAVKMVKSGYGNRDILTFMKSGVNLYEKMCRDDREGVRPLYRPRDYRTIERWHKKIAKKSSWSRSESVCFIPFSKKLKEAVENSITNSKENIRVVERGGVSLKKLLQKSNPHKETFCTDKQCSVCRVREGGQDGCKPGGCNIDGVGYVVTCLDCQENGRDYHYEGETGHSLRQRSSQHERDLRSGNTNSGLVRHSQQHHEGVTPRYRYQVRKVFDDALTRQIEEGVRIESYPENQLMNTRHEWVPPVVSRVQIV